MAEENSDVIVPLNLEIGTGAILPISDRLYAQLGIYYQPPISRYGREKISFSTIGVNASFWFKGRK